MWLIARYTNRYHKKYTVLYFFCTHLYWYIPWARIYNDMYVFRTLVCAVLACCRSSSNRKAFGSVTMPQIKSLCFFFGEFACRTVKTFNPKLSLIFPCTWTIRVLHKLRQWRCLTIDLFEIYFKNLLNCTLRMSNGTDSSTLNTQGHPTPGTNQHFLMRLKLFNV